MLFVRFLAPRVRRCGHSRTQNNNSPPPAQHTGIMAAIVAQNTAAAGCVCRGVSPHARDTGLIFSAGVREEFTIPLSLVFPVPRVSRLWTGGRLLAPSNFGAPKPRTPCSVATHCHCRVLARERDAPPPGEERRQGRFVDFSVLKKYRVVTPPNKCPTCRLP